MKLYLFLIGTILFSCYDSNKQVNTLVSSPDKFESREKQYTEIKPLDFSKGPFVIIYKTKKDYSENVPVTLNDDKTKITSYPGIKDIFYNGKLALPTKLNDGFLLDNRGINKDVAFLNMTYEEYSKLKEIPLIKDLMKMIIDKDPLTEMYNCGSRSQYKDIANDLNKIISDNQINRFKKIL
jgi:hypothetical protein